ncbi:MAG: hypothetical protein H8K03_11210 [Nitrospira sp.]|jgi:hypothetical protein|nr:hypothetical protein [Nitrospira sp. BO4]
MSAPIRFLDHSRITVYLIVFLCVCVLVQMLGLPITMLNFFTPDDLLTASICADPSIVPSVPELHLTNPLSFCVDRDPSLTPPLFITSVFHPPLT